MRLFIAILLDQKLKDLAMDIQDDFRMEQIRGNYTPEENLHLTLAFIGEYSDPEKVLELLHKIEFSPFPIMMNKIGCFDDLWWAGFESSEALNNLVRNIRHVLADEEIPFDRKKFKPHVTLLRKAEYIAQRPAPIVFDHEQMQVKKISLMRSTRGKHGMIYTELGSVAASKKD